MKLTAQSVQIALLFVLISPSLYGTHSLGVCAIFRDEAPFLREWIEFHKIQGVEHFYLYNNSSEDDYLSVLHPYIENEQVTLVDWGYSFAPGNGKPVEWAKVQTGAYTHCLETHGKDCNWIAFIDIDEFLFCPSGKTLPSFLEDFVWAGGVGVNWLLFGTSGIAETPENTLMIELLLFCASRELAFNRYFKSIVQPKYTVRALNAHDFGYSEGFEAIDSNGDPFGQLAPSSRLLIDDIRINHYWTRTEKDFTERKIKSRGRRRTQDTLESLRKTADKYNLSMDTEILKFVPQLRHNLGFEIE